jgi:hypothetical protein
MTMITKEFSRYEFVGNRFACEDCAEFGPLENGGDAVNDVIRCTRWFADEGDREVIWYQCACCLQGEFQLDTRDDLHSHSRELAAWLKTDKREPLNLADDFPPSPDGKTLGEAILEILSGDA